VLSYRAPQPPVKLHHKKFEFLWLGVIEFFSGTAQSSLNALEQWTRDFAIKVKA